MHRRFIVAALTALALAAPATAAAQSPDPAARAFADAALRAAPEIAAASEQLAAMQHRPACKARVPKRHRTQVAELKSMFHVAHTIAGFTRAVVPTLLRASNELHAVETSDPALRSGRTAWRRLRRAYEGFAALPAGKPCAEVRAFVDNGFRHTATTRRTERAFHAMMAWDTGDIDRRMKRAVDRLVELGIPAAEADAFDGELGE
jgi:hypothetical protein